MKKLYITKKVIEWLENKTGENINFNFNDLDNREDFKGYTLSEYVKEQYADELKEYRKEVLENDK